MKKDIKEIRDTGTVIDQDSDPGTRDELKESLENEDQICENIKSRGSNKKQSDKKNNRKNRSINRSTNDRSMNLAAQIETSRQVLQLMTDSNFTITQINGQRKLGGPPPGWAGDAPGAGCEVFVGKIPRTIYEHEIYPVFRAMGEVYEIRLMMDFSGTNRGYCFVMFAKPEYARRAIRELDNFEILPGRRIGVVASINNCRLTIGYLPPNVDSKVVIKKLYTITDDVEKVAVYRNSNGQAKFALASYKTHRGAAMARRRLVPERSTLFEGSEVSVDWAHPAVFPSNVIEERGICDERGNVLLTTTIVGTEAKRCENRRRPRDEYLEQKIRRYIKDGRSPVLFNKQNRTQDTSSKSQEEEINDELNIDCSLDCLDNFQISEAEWFQIQEKNSEHADVENHCQVENNDSLNLFDKYTFMEMPASGNASNQIENLSNYKSLESKSDGDIIKYQNMENQEKSNGFDECGKWNSADSFIPRFPPQSYIKSGTNNPDIQSHVNNLAGNIKNGLKNKNYRQAFLEFLLNDAKNDRHTHQQYPVTVLMNNGKNDIPLIPSNSMYNPNMIQNLHIQDQAPHVLSNINTNFIAWNQNKHQASNVAFTNVLCGCQNYTKPFAGLTFNYSNQTNNLLPALDIGYIPRNHSLINAPIPIIPLKYESPVLTCSDTSQFLNNSQSALFADNAVPKGARPILNRTYV